MSIKIEKKTSKGNKFKIEITENEIYLGNCDHIIEKDDWPFIRDVINTMLDYEEDVSILGERQPDVPKKGASDE